MFKYYKLMMNTEGKPFLKESEGEVKITYHNITFYAEKINKKFVITEESSGMKLYKFNTLEQFNSYIYDNINKIKTALNSEEVKNNITIKEKLLKELQSNNFISC